MNNMNAIKPPKITALQKQIDGLIKILRKTVEKEFEVRVQLRIKEYISRHMPELEQRREELAKKIDYYEKLTNKHKPIFTADEFKTILMCLHPDGERSKEKLEDAFVNFKSKEIQLVGRKK